MTEIFTLKDINHFITELAVQKITEGYIINQYYPKDSYSLPVDRIDELFLMLEKGDKLVMIKFKETRNDGSFKLTMSEANKEHDQSDDYRYRYLERQSKTIYERTFYEISHTVYTDDKLHQEATNKKREDRKAGRKYIEDRLFHEMEVETEIKGFKTAVLRHKLGNRQLLGSLELVNRNGRVITLGLIERSVYKQGLSLTSSGRQIKEQINTIRRR